MEPYDDDDDAYMGEDCLDDYEPGICDACNGSGEGMREGTTCRTCRGSGEC